MTKFPVKGFVRFKIFFVGLKLADFCKFVIGN